MDSSHLKSLMAELREEYLNGFPEKYLRLQDCFAKQDWYSIELEYHKLKGTGTTYGVPEVTELCEVLERLCRNNKSIDKNVLDLSIELLKKIKQKYQENQDFNLAANKDFQKLKMQAID